jgi:hypothetical protein
MKVQPGTHDAAAIRKELASSSAAVRLLFMLDGMPGGISPGHAGCTPARAARLSELGILAAVDWRPPSSGRTVRRWLRLMPTPLGSALVPELAEAFRQHNIMAPDRGVDALYLLGKERLKYEARDRKVAWTAAVTKAVEAVVGQTAIRPAETAAPRRKGDPSD